MIDFVYKQILIKIKSDQETMAKYGQDFDFNSVIDSERAKEKRLVEPQLQSEDLGQNIKIGIASEPKIMTSDISQKNSHSVPLDSKSYDLKNAAHPTICIFTFIFKVAAFITYFIIGNFISSILTFIFVLVLSAMDFWFVKNISGRILVGLRWRSAYDEEGKETWKFQSYDHEFNSNSVDRLFFWASQAGFCVIWGILLLLNLLTLDLFWALLLMIALGLCGANLYGYYQCRDEYKKKVGALKSKYGRKVFKQIVEQVL